MRRLKRLYESSKETEYFVRMGTVSKWRHPKLHEYSKKLLKLFNAKKGALVLDAGVGTGIHAIEIAKLCDVVGLDVSREMLTMTKLSIKRLNIKSIHLVLGDIQNMPFKNEAFDKVFALEHYFHVPDYYKAVSELIRSTKFGGMLLIEVFNMFHISTCLEKLSHILSEFLRKESPPYHIRTPKTILKPFQSFHFKVYGFHVLMPTWLPKVGYKFNFARKEPFFSKLGERSLFKMLGVQLVVKVIKLNKNAYAER
ncbi:MAG: class I SAM-dependent methyltransferase [Candidatus Bathyarchaeia archaeon]